MFLPPSMLSSGKLKDAKPQSLLLPLTQYGEPFLVTGGEIPHAVMLEGSHAGHFMPLEEGEHYDGLCVHGVEIEVDIESAYEAFAMHRRKLSFIASGGNQGIVGLPGQNSTGRIGPVISWAGAPIDMHAPAVGFTSWDAVIRLGDARHVVYSHRGTPAKP